MSPPRELQGSEITAHRVEFVAVPGKTARIRGTLPAAIQETFREVAGFAGCMVLVADMEARLVTVITLWKGAERARHCEVNAKWVKKLLTPYVDRWLRVQTLIAALPSAQLVPDELDESMHARASR